MSLASTVTMTELKKQAKARGIKGSANMTKVQLCKALGLKGNCMPFSRCLNYAPISNAMAAEHPFIQNLNCYNLPLQHIKYILGPCSFYQYNYVCGNLVRDSQNRKGSRCSRGGVSKRGRTHRLTVWTFRSGVLAVSKRPPKHRGRSPVRVPTVQGNARRRERFGRSEDLLLDPP